MSRIYANRSNLRTRRDMRTTMTEGVQQREDGHEPMELDHFRRQGIICSWCNKRGHHVRDCRARKKSKQVNVVSYAPRNSGANKQGCFTCGQTRSLCKGVSWKEEKSRG